MSMPHPSLALLPEPMADDYSSFVRDDDGEMIATYIAHWRTLYYLPYFHPGDPSDVPAFRKVETSPFPDAIETFEASRADITLRVISFGSVANTVLAAYQFLSTGPLAVDLRFTAPDVETAAKWAGQAWQARVRPPIGPFPIVPFAKAEAMVLDNATQPISRDAPELILMEPLPKKSRVIWRRRFIRDPYMAGIGELKTGEIHVQFTGKKHPVFAVRSRKAGLEWIDNVFQALLET